MKSHQEIPLILGSDDPFTVFKQWLEKARTHPGIKEPSAMILSTCFKEQPSSRVVLLKDFSSEGFTFFTNYKSEKGQHLALNPKAALNFYWDPLSLQCRVEGLIHLVSRSTSEAYWKSRARESQLSQWISHQSEVAESRQQLESLVQDAQSRFNGKDVPCPEHWGGYILIPERFEFWMGRQNRLHDRFLFKKQNQEWIGLRIFP